MPKTSEFEFFLSKDVTPYSSIGYKEKRFDNLEAVFMNQRMMLRRVNIRCSSY
jgi:hypothetical protein